jgi:D-alanine-D-alanine ligase
MHEDRRQERLDITVLMGGPSDEREVSLMSGAAIATALQQAGHQVTRADITPFDTAALNRDGLDVVFIALHGDFGESGEVQQLCEDRGLRYVGSSPRASRLGMDKAASKQYFLRAGLTTPDWMVLENFHRPAQVNEWLGELPLPVVVKPVSGGSSIDITICRSVDQRDEAIANQFEKYGRAMVERFIAGRELTVGIIGEHPLSVLEIRPRHEFYDYEAKYADDTGTEYVFDHGLSDDLVERIQFEAMQAHRCIDCRDLSRVDFILDDHQVPQVLEINTIPGFTSHSLVPMAARHEGVEMSALCDRLVRMAMARQMCLS